jgi:hypothetical protein
MSELSDDALRARLSRLDPAGSAVPVDPASSPRAAELMERAMQSVETPPPVDLASRRRRRRPQIWLAGAAAAAAAIVVAVIIGTTGGGGTGGGSGPAHQPTTLALALPGSDVSLSCIRFDVAFLREMPVAFAGTVASVDKEQVTIDVDHWYKGGDADRVTLSVAPGQTSVALDGVDWRQGGRYLVTATNGTVNGCGFSGPATPDLEQAFDQAFGG